MLIQCFLGLAMMTLPSILQKHLSFELPNSMCIIYFVFLYCAIYLGDVRNFYYIIPHWDTILHGFSGVMLGAFGFSLVKILNDSDKIHVVLSPAFICLFAFLQVIIIVVKLNPLVTTILTIEITTFIISNVSIIFTPSLVYLFSYH